MLRAMATTVAVGVLVAATGCSSDSESDAEPSAPLTEATIDCNESADAAERILVAQSALYSGDDAALDTLLAELEALSDSAPEDVRETLSQLADGYRSTQELLNEPTEEDKQELTELAPQLAENSDRLTQYLLEQCQE